MKKFSFVILNYNTEKEVIQCIGSIEKIHKNDCQVNYIVVDNNSDAKALSAMQCKLKKYPNAIVLKMGENLGYSKANNIGYQYALKKFSPDFVGIINSDTKIIQKDFLYKVLYLYQKYRFSVLGPDIYVPHRRWHQSPNINSIEYSEASIMNRVAELECDLKELKIKKENGITYSSRYNIKKELIRNTVKNIWSFITHTRHRRTYINVYLHGAALFFSKKYMNKYSEKCFEPEVYMYGEEDLLKYKCDSNGDIMLYSPKVKVLHLAGASTDKVIGNKNMIDRVIFSVENECISKRVLLEEIRKNINEE